MGAEATAFLARTSGLDTTHTNAYTALIDGLVADGIWSKLDVLHVLATQDSTTALLNLVSTSYTGVAHGSPTFTADRGFTGVESSGTVYIDPQFNPSTATTPKFTQNSAHLSVWNVTNTSSGWPSIGCSDGFGSLYSYIYPKYTGDGNAYVRINATAGSGQTAANSDASGFFIGNRSSSTHLEGYRNGSSILSSGGLTSTTVSQGIVYLGFFSQGAGISGAGQQQAAISIGSSLSSTDVTNFYNRLRTYMTVVGVP